MDFQCCQGILCSLLSKKKKKNREAFTDTPNCAVKSYINSKKKCRLFLKKGTLGFLSLFDRHFLPLLLLSLSLFDCHCVLLLRLSLVDSLFDCHFVILLLLSLFDSIVTF
jgi:hypothetical protein